jgi:hypothetical protein
VSGFPHRTGATKGKRQHGINALSLAIMLEEMLDGPFTTRNLMEVSGLGKSSVYRYVRTFHARSVVHISGWEKDAAGRALIPVYSLGRGSDAKRKNKSKAEINRGYAERKRMKLVADGLNARLASALMAA